MFFEDNLSDSDSSADGLNAENRNSTTSHTTTAEVAIAAFAAGGSASDVIGGLIQACECERFCPDILPYPSELIDRAATQIARSHSRADQLAEQERREAADSESGSSLLPFKASNILKLEVQRCQFFLTELLRCRIRKIESLSCLIAYERVLEEEGDGTAAVEHPQRHHLSDNEKVVADRLAEMAQQCVLRSGMQSAPVQLRSLVPNPPYGEGMEILPQPDVNVYIFGAALEDLGVVELDDGASQEIKAGEVFLMPYRTLRPFVVGGQVRLV
ncbi:GINS complex subunit 4 [Angomonas deanei]|uniref:DNA replication complex GINS protein SLD5 n=1 Tax=Angomonas deanei TaxID=59799 RepID=A0A7G2CFQ5_9TRYP|nr:GINS complex subunit 4 [Angomonas deanei]CAD2218616.1 DNA replication complex GINS protein SLD5 C-terminus, putative [Angomonas deanei]|eukprot:EPY28000.1 GINS complex subunit 4 [Angomonas deanei]